MNYTNFMNNDDINYQSTLYSDSSRCMNNGMSTKNQTTQDVNCAPLKKHSLHLNRDSYDNESHSVGSSATHGTLAHNDSYMSMYDDSTKLNDDTSLLYSNNSFLPSLSLGQFRTDCHISPSPTFDNQSNLSFNKCSPTPFGESLNEPYPSVQDMSLPNLQDVMEEDWLHPSISMSTPTTLSSNVPLGSRPYASVTPMDLYSSSFNRSKYSNFNSYYQPGFMSMRSPVYEPTIDDIIDTSYPLSFTPQVDLASRPLSTSRPLQEPRKTYKKRDNNSRRDHIQSLHSYHGHILEMAKDHNGCRIIQQALTEASKDMIIEMFNEIKGSLSELMVDPFGNYLFQKILDLSTKEMKNEILTTVQSSLVYASFNVHGTRSVQNLVTTCSTPEQVEVILKAIQGHIASLASHVNGNHVIQRCLQCYSEEQCESIYDEIVKSCVDISTHRHGCCVVQRCFTNAPDHYHQELFKEIESHALVLISDPFGNYVIQYVLEHGAENEITILSHKVLGHVVDYCCQKYSSNVIEKIILINDEELVSAIINEIISSSNFVSLLHHDFANYVIQKILKTCSLKNKELLLNAIRPHMSGLNKSTGGRHILALVQE